MKKLFTPLLLLAAFFNAQAQQTAPIQGLEPVQNHSLQNFTNVHHTDPSRVGGSIWYDYSDACFITNISTFHANFIFPDTTVVVTYDDGSGGTVLGGPWIHSISQVLDPTSYKFGILAQPGDITFGATDAYNVDSVGVFFFYNRNHPNANIVDTLVLEIGNDNAGSSSNIGTYYFSDPNGPSSTYWTDNYGDDTVRFKDIKYLYQPNSMNNPGKITRKILLDSNTLNDTLAGGITYRSVDAGSMTINPGKKVAVSMRFVPGYTWTPNQDPVEILNTVEFLSLEENGPDSYQLYVPGDYNCSHIINDATRYNVTGNGWNGFYLPSYAFTSASYGYEMHAFDYKLSCATCNALSANSPELNLGFELYPNPATNVLTVTGATKMAGEMTFTLTDITGQMFMNGTLDQHAGSFQQNLNISTLAPGIYMLTVGNAAGSVVKKFIVD